MPGPLGRRASGAPFLTFPLSLTWLAGGSKLSEREGWSGGENEGHSQGGGRSPGAGGGRGQGHKIGPTQAWVPVPLWSLTHPLV